MNIKIVLLSILTLPTAVYSADESEDIKEKIDHIEVEKSKDGKNVFFTLDGQTKHLALVLTNPKGPFRISFGGNILICRNFPELDNSLGANKESVTFSFFVHDPANKFSKRMGATGLGIVREETVYFN